MTGETCTTRRYFRIIADGVRLCKKHYKPIKNVNAKCDDWADRFEKDPPKGKLK